jgi:DNA polymerase-3 subunit alpha
MPRFVHLHIHSEFSLVDGLVRIKPLIKNVQTAQMPACAMTDFSNLYGLVQFYKAANAAGIKPIIGADVVIDNGDAPASRLILLCQNRRGYIHLSELISQAHLEGLKKEVPHLRREWFAKRSDGLIALSAGRLGDIGQALLSGDTEQAKQYLQFWQAYFPNRFYLELQRTGRPQEEDYIHAAVQLAIETYTPVVATNDVVFLKEEDYEAHEVRVCIHDGYVLDDNRRPRLYSPQQYLRSPEEMATLFSDIPEAIENTWRIAQRCNIELTLGKNYLPNFPVPAGMTMDKYFCELSRKGLDERFETVLKNKIDQRQEYDERLQIELDVILQMGFPGYFLIVADFIQWSKDNGVPVGPGRGSGAGSIVAYALKITDLDPIEYDLLFERFLNPERVSMPDFDIDFCMEGRDRVIQYVAETYGKEHVSQIITFGTMAAKAVVRDVGRVLGHPYPFVDQISKLIPFEIGITLSKAMEQEEQLKNRYENDEDVRAIIDMALKLEGLTRNVGTHAGGVVIGPSKLTDFCPLYWDGNPENTMVTQLDKNDVETIGLVKFDFLGLRTLTIIKWALENIVKIGSKAPDMLQIPLNDQATFDLLKKAHTTAVFQLESRGMKELIKRLLPDCFEDIVALVALFRPGPLQSGMVDDFINRKHGRAKIEYPHPDLEPILKPTYGIILYQEQVMQISQVLANYTLGGADLLRRAMGKKKPEEMAKQRTTFTEGALKRNVDEKIATYVFDLMEKFAGYGFNKCIVGSTLIANPNTGELLTVKSLFENGIKQVASLQANQKMGISDVVQVMENGVKFVFTLTTATGKQITTTDNHPFLTAEGWKPLSKLRIGQRIASPAQLPIEGKENWEAYKLITLGWVISEGNTCHPSGFYFYNQNIDSIDDFVNAVSQFDNTQPTIKLREDRANTWEVYAGIGQNTRRVKDGVMVQTEVQECKIYFANSKLNQNSTIFCRTTKDGNNQQPLSRSGARLWLEQINMINLKASEKHFPVEIFKLDNTSLSILIGRYWSGDGFIAGKNNMIPYAASASKRLLQELQHLLLRFGIVSKLTEKYFTYKEGRIGYTLHLLGRRSIEQFLQYIGPHLIGRQIQVQKLKQYLQDTLSDKESIDTLPAEIKYQVRQEKQNIGLTWLEIENESGVCVREFYGEVKSHKLGFRRTTIRKLANFFDSAQLKQQVEADIFWETIVSIESAGTEMTYDLEVQNTHNFVANDLIIHNSHSAAYAFVSYQTAWLKTHYPAAFMAAVLSSDMDNTDKVVGLIDDCREMKLDVKPPHVNYCDYKFTIADNKTILYGLGAIKGVGENAIENIVISRKENQKFTDLFDFCKKIDLRKVNRRVLEALVKSGCFDNMGASRATLAASLDTAIKLAERHASDRNTGQNNLFGMFDAPEEKTEEKVPYAEDVLEWTDIQRLNGEKDCLGLYLTGHPIDQYKNELQKFSYTPLSKIRPTNRGATAKIIGLVLSVRTVNSRRGKMAIVQLDDNTGRLEATMFSDLYHEVQSKLQKDSILVIEGEVREDEYSGGFTMNASSVMSFIEAREKSARYLTIQLTEQQINKQFTQNLLKILQANQGRCPVVVNYQNKNADIRLRLGNQWCIMPSDDFINQLETLIGREKVQVYY